MKVNAEELQQIIKEEALRLKKRMMLESEKASIIKKLKESGEYCEPEKEGIDEIFGLGGGAFKKAKNDYMATHQAELAKLNQAHKTYSPDYVTISKQLISTLAQENSALAKKYGISGSDASVLYKDLKAIAEPTDIATFNRQAAKGGASFSDVAQGANAGRANWTANEGKIVK